jgi:Spy/CpxP family protein refolding chaperone
MEVEMDKKAKGIIILAVVAIFGIATLSSAGWGRGYGHMMGGYGYGPGGYSGNLSNEEFEKLDKQRSEYFKATNNTRQKLYEKELALRSELAKENPDTSKASNLQGEISKLQSDLDQKRLDYEIQARKTSPNYDRGRRGGYGPMMGYGPGGGRYCWR